MVALLFVYGTLMPANAETAERDGWTADAVRGRLFDLGPHPALVELDGPCADWVEGYVRAVERAELEGPLDAWEGVADGIFCRMETTTRNGERAWVYVYSQPLPPAAHGPLLRWHGRRGVWPKPA
jgi:gamma-glutamylcyclotransferase (GGCT)/AIG2-like uncharacterized protein YtfP